MMIQNSFNDNNNISLDKFVPNINTPNFIFGLELADDVSIFDQRYFYEMSYFLYSGIYVNVKNRIKYTYRMLDMKKDLMSNDVIGKFSNELKTTFERNLHLHKFSKKSLSFKPLNIFGITRRKIKDIAIKSAEIHYFSGKNTSFRTLNLDINKRKHLYIERSLYTVIPLYYKIVFYKAFPLANKNFNNNPIYILRTRRRRFIKISYSGFRIYVKNRRYKRKFKNKFVRKVFKNNKQRKIFFKYLRLKKLVKNYVQTFYKRNLNKIYLKKRLKTKKYPKHHKNYLKRSLKSKHYFRKLKKKFLMAMPLPFTYINPLERYTELLQQGFTEEAAELLHEVNVFIVDHLKTNYLTFSDIQGIAQDTRGWELTEDFFYNACDFIIEKLALKDFVVAETTCKIFNKLNDLGEHTFTVVRPAASDVFEAIKMPNLPSNPETFPETSWYDFFSDNLIYICIGTFIIAGISIATYYYFKKPIDNSPKIEDVLPKESTDIVELNSIYEVTIFDYKDIFIITSLFFIIFFIFLKLKKHLF